MSDTGVTVKKSNNFSEWYVEVVLKSGLADYAPIKGCMIFKPQSYAIDIIFSCAYCLTILEAPL